MEQVRTFLHQGSIGDCWASLPAMNEFYRKKKMRVVLYLQSGVPAFYYENAVHPTMDKDGKTNVMLNDAVINMMIPLFKTQECIADCKVWNNEPINVNLGRIRDTFVNMPYHSLSKWYFYIFPDLYCDLSTKWMTVPDTDKDFAKGKIIVTRSERYLNGSINYLFLKKYEKDILFVGTELEYWIFKLRYNLNIERWVINDFLELAQGLKQCKFHLTNQTSAAQISEGLKIPRIVELCKMAPNVDFIGENAFEFYNQDALQYFTAVLNGENPEVDFNGFPAPPKID